MLLTVDIGTSNFKSALWDYDGNRLAFVIYPLPENYFNDDKHEAECEIWLRAFENCCRKLGSLSSVKAVIISGNGPSLVPVLGEPSVKNDGLAVPAEKARLWLDRRAVEYQEKVSSVMGGFVDAGFFLPKIMSIKFNESELYERVKYFIGCPEYLAYALTGEARTVFPSDGFDRWFWNDNIIKELNLDAEKFPAFIRPGDQFGTIIPVVAGYFGFGKNIPVISGGPDFFAAILGARVTQPSVVCDRTGSSEGINLCTEKRINDKRLMSYGHPVKPYWNLSGIINTTGKAIEWCRNLLGLSSYEDFFALAQKSKPGSQSVVFNPYLTGERAPIWDPSITGNWSGITFAAGRSEFANSALEGICFAIRDVIAVMEEAGGVVHELRVTGGLAGNGYLNQIKADITGKKILEPVCREAELLGLAVIGACCLGKYSSFAEASEAMVKIEKHYEPNTENAELYSRLFDKYRKIRLP